MAVVFFMLLYIPAAVSSTVANRVQGTYQVGVAWGNGDAGYWSFWLTDGTGVGQNDPSHLLDSTVMTISYDVFVYDPAIGDGNGQYAAWYDQYFLQGVVGGQGGYVSFESDVSMWKGTTGVSGETYLNGLTWEYRKDTPGSAEENHN